MAETRGPKGKVSVPRCSPISEGDLTRTPGVKQASDGSLSDIHRELGNAEAAMPARGTEGRGGVVTERHAVRAGTW